MAEEGIGSLMGVIGTNIVGVEQPETVRLRVKHKIHKTKRKLNLFMQLLIRPQRFVVRSLLLPGMFLLPIYNLYHRLILRKHSHLPAPTAY